MSAKIALWHNPDCDDETSQDSDDDDDTSNDLNSNNDETDVPIMFWLQDRVCYLIESRNRIRTSLDGNSLFTLPDATTPPLLAPAWRSSRGQTLPLLNTRVSHGTACGRLGGLFTAEVVGLSELKCRLTLGVLARPAVTWSPNIDQANAAPLQSATDAKAYVAYADVAQ